MAEYERIPGVKEQYPDLDKIEHGDLADLIDNDLRFDAIDGRIIIQGKEGEIIGYEAMYESIFVNSWLAQFAIDEVNGKRYFDMPGWSLITDKLVKGVIIVEDGTNNVLFIIPSFSRPMLSPDGAHELKDISAKANFAKNIQDPMEQKRFIEAYARRVEKIVSAEGEDYGLTRLVPAEFYAKHNVVPQALKAMIYIRDEFGVQPDTDEFRKTEAILAKHYKGLQTSPSEREYVTQVTHGRYHFEYIEGDVEQEKPVLPKTTATASPFDD